MANQGWVALANLPPTATVTNNTFTGPQDITQAGTQQSGVTLNVPGAFFQIGQSWRMTAAGTYSVTGTPTLQFGIYVATFLQAQAPALTASSGVTTMNWRIQADGTVRALGGGASATGTMVWSGLLTYAVSSNTAAPSFLPIWQAPMGVGTAFDSTVADVLTLKATYGTSSASNIVVLHEYLLEYLN